MRFVLDLCRALLVLVLIVAVLALLLAGIIAGLAWLGDGALVIGQDVADKIGLATSPEDLRLPALWATYSPYVYATAATAALALVFLFVLRRPKKKREPQDRTRPISAPTEGDLHD